MGLLMIDKISPHPSLLKRGTEGEKLCQRGGKKERNFAKEGNRKDKNDPLTDAMSVFFK
jgi:hypothetical protein